MFAESALVPAPHSNWVCLDDAAPLLVYELRNALATLNVALELADARLRAAGAAGAALHAGAAPTVAHANELLTDVLTLTRAPRAHARPFDLGQLVEEVARAPEQVGPMGMGVGAGPPPPVPALRLPARALAFGDAAATATALRHVLRNAREATSARIGHIEIELDEGEGGWEVHVLDDGAGVANEVAGRLFAPFVSAKRRHLGLGLTHAWRHMRAQRGALAVTTRAADRFGRGASFCLSVPREPRGENSW